MNVILIFIRYNIGVYLKKLNILNKQPLLYLLSHNKFTTYDVYSDVSEFTPTKVSLFKVFTGQYMVKDE